MYAHCGIYSVVPLPNKRERCLEERESVCVHVLTYIKGGEGRFGKYGDGCTASVQSISAALALSFTARSVTLHTAAVALLQSPSEEQKLSLTPFKAVISYVNVYPSPY